MEIPNIILALRCTCVVNAALKETRHWGADVPVVSEYSTYSESQVQVYHHDEHISSTDTGVSLTRIRDDCECIAT